MTPGQQDRTRKREQKVFVLGLEPRTVCVLDRRDNQLHHTNFLFDIGHPFNTFIYTQSYNEHVIARALEVTCWSLML